MKMYEITLSKTAYSPENRESLDKTYLDVRAYPMIRECIQQCLLVGVPLAKISDM
jgi:hypothetical protein